MSKSIPPPELTESMSWTDYKKEIKIWQALTMSTAEKSGPWLYLLLKGKVRKAALELDIDNIKGENDVCECHNAAIKESVRKTMKETNFKLETAVVWAVSAKNSLSGHQGYSPNMLVFGRNPNYPNVLTSELPALETQVSRVTVENNLEAMNSAREAFIQSECSEKIKRALKHTVRSCNDAVFDNGDKVYYKRNNNSKWKGPGYAIGQENKNVLMKHGGKLRRVHPAS